MCRAVARTCIYSNSGEKSDGRSERERKISFLFDDFSPRSGDTTAPAVAAETATAAVSSHHAADDDQLPVAATEEVVVAVLPVRHVGLVVVGVGVKEVVGEEAKWSDALAWTTVSRRPCRRWAGG